MENVAVGTDFGGRIYETVFNASGTWLLHQ